MSKSHDRFSQHVGTLETITNLQQLLENLATTPACGLATVASPKSLASLRAAATFLGAAGSGDFHTVSEPAIIATVLSSAELAVQQLLEPSPELYSTVGGAPCQTPAELQIAADTYQEIVVTKLHILHLLLKYLGPVQLTAQPEPQTAAVAADKNDSKARNRPTYVVGIVEITEEPDIPDSPTQQLQTRIQQLVLQSILACALYAASSCSKSSNHLISSDTNSSEGHKTASCGTSSQCESLRAGCCDLESYSEAATQQGWELSTPWSDQQCQQQCQQILQQIAKTATVTTDQHPAAAERGGKVKDCGNQQQQQDEQEERQQNLDCRLPELLHALLPQLVDSLRGVLLAQHRHRRLQEKGDLVPYKGPDIFHRCLAARQLAWISQQLLTPQITQETCSVLLPLALATADDPAPAVQQYGHAVLSWLAVHSQHGVLSWHRELLIDEAKRLVVGCEESCWRTAMSAATNLVIAVEERHDVRAAGYHTIVQELITEAERNAQNAHKRLIVMACMAKLIPCLGLYIVRYLMQLMPLLLEWTHAYDQGTVVVALQVLGLVVKYAWPRMGSYSHILWDHLIEVVKATDAKAWMDDIRQSTAQQSQRQPKGPTPEILGAAVQLGQLLCACGGEQFTAIILAYATAVDEDGGVRSPTLDALLRACIQV